MGLKSQSNKLLDFTPPYKYEGGGGGGGVNSGRRTPEVALVVRYYTSVSIFFIISCKTDVVTVC